MKTTTFPQACFVYPFVLVMNLVGLDTWKDSIQRNRNEYHISIPDKLCRINDGVQDTGRWS